MFELGWTELLVIAVVAIIVVGPRDLPGMLRNVGQMIGRLRRMAGDFQKTFNEAVKDAERQAGVEEIKKEVDTVSKLNPLNDLKKSVDLNVSDGKSANKKENNSALGDESKIEVESHSVNVNSKADENVSEDKLVEQEEVAKSKESIEKKDSKGADTPTVVHSSIDGTAVQEEKALTTNQV